MSVDILRQLRARAKIPSYLSEPEWEEVFAALDRGVFVKDLFIAFGQFRGYTTVRGFEGAIANRRKLYPKGKNPDRRKKHR